jgi:dipeptide/tripeptide permease
MSGASGSNILVAELENLPIKSKHEVLSATSNTVMIGILLTETMASFAYYGSQIVLVLYLRQSLGYSESSSVALFSFISSVSDLAPISGAILADGWLGRYKTILYFGSIAALGLFITTVGAMSTKDTLSTITNENDAMQSHGIHVLQHLPLSWRKGLSFAGLILFFGGVRCIDPCLSSFGADQVSLLSHAPSQTGSPETQSPPDDHQTEQQERRIRNFFAFFYFCMNIGALAAYGFIPFVREYNGFGTAFLVCAFCMMFGRTCFLSKRRKYVDSTFASSTNDPSSSLASTIVLCCKIVRQRFLRAVGQWTARGFLVRPLRHETTLLSPDGSPKHNGNERLFSNCEVTETCCYGACEMNGMEANGLRRDAEQALRVIPIMAMLPAFWMLYDQQESVWILQASRMTLHGLQPEQLSLVNPIEIAIFIPLFDHYVYPTLTRCGWKLDPLARMGIGMLFAATSFLVSGALEVAIQLAEARAVPPPSVFWQMFQITIMALSEIFVYVTSLEFAYSSAPVTLKAFLVATFSLTKAIGDLCGGVLYSTVFQDWNRATVMYACALLMLVNRAVFGKVAEEWYRSRSQSNRDMGESMQPVKCSSHAGESSILIPC